MNHDDDFEFSVKCYNNSSSIFTHLIQDFFPFVSFIAFECADFSFLKRGKTVPISLMRLYFYDAFSLSSSSLCSFYVCVLVSYEEKKTFYCSKCMNRTELLSHNNEFATAVVFPFSNVFFSLSQTTILQAYKCHCMCCTHITLINKLKKNRKIKMNNIQP